MTQSHTIFERMPEFRERQLPQQLGSHGNQCRTITGGSSNRLCLKMAVVIRSSTTRQQLRAGIDSQRTWP